MERITTILPRESARLDAEQLERLYTTLGEVEADNVLSRAMEEMALRIEQSEKLFDAGSSSEMRRTICSLIKWECTLSRVYLVMCWYVLIVAIGFRWGQTLRA